MNKHSSLFVSTDKSSRAFLPILDQHGKEPSLIVWYGKVLHSGKLLDIRLGREDKSGTNL